MELDPLKNELEFQPIEISWIGYFTRQDDNNLKNEKTTLGKIF